MLALPAKCSVRGEKGVFSNHWPERGRAGREKPLQRQTLPGAETTPEAPTRTSQHLRSETDAGNTQPCPLGGRQVCPAGPPQSWVVCELLASAAVLQSHLPLGIPARKRPCFGRTGLSPGFLCPGCRPGPSQPILPLKEGILPASAVT